MYGPAIAVPCIVLRMLCTSYVLSSVLYSLGLMCTKYVLSSVLYIGLSYDSIPYV